MWYFRCCAVCVCVCVCVDKHLLATLKTRLAGTRVWLFTVCLGEKASCFDRVHVTRNENEQRQKKTKTHQHAHAAHTNSTKTQQPTNTHTLTRIYTGGQLTDRRRRLVLVMVALGPRVVALVKKLKAHSAWISWSFVQYCSLAWGRDQFWLMITTGVGWMWTRRLRLLAEHKKVEKTTEEKTMTTMWKNEFNRQTMCAIRFHWSNHWKGNRRRKIIFVRWGRMNDGDNSSSCNCTRNVVNDRRTRSDSWWRIVCVGSGVDHQQLIVVVVVVVVVVSIFLQWWQRERRRCPAMEVGVGRRKETILLRCTHEGVVHCRNREEETKKWRRPRRWRRWWWWCLPMVW